jgi:mRNA-degrading endonuclease RelE of RelBE toxin-antitoxin system
VTVRVKSQARRSMLKLPDAILIKTFRIILRIKDAPYPRGFKKVRGQKDRLRVWIDRDYRIIYDVDSDAEVIDIVYVGIKSEDTYRP